MKITLPGNSAPRPRPMVPTVCLTDEAYDILLSLSTDYNVSMRKIASAIIVSAFANLEIEKEDDSNE